MKNGFSVISFIVGGMLGALVTGAWFSNDSFSTFSGSAPNTSTTTSPTLEIESGALSVADQPSGNTVIVESVTVPPPGVWVAVREMNGGVLGNVLGAARVTGPRTGVEIPLLRSTAPGLVYAVELYRDDGDNLFDLTTDSVYIDFTTSAPVIEHFTTTE